MTKQLVDIGPAMKKIRDVGKTEPRIDPALIAAALGAEPAPATPRIVAGNPFTLYAVRAEVFRRLQSSGGRPSLEGTTRRSKIPLSEQQWEKLEAIADTVTGDGCTPSAGQIASVLLDLALQSVLTDSTATTSKQLRERLAQANAKS